MFRGKKYQDAAKQIEKNTQYDAAEGFGLICKTASAKFDETVELHVKLGVDSRHADQPLVPPIRDRLLMLKGQQDTYRRLCGNSYNREYLGYLCVDEIGNIIRPNYVSEQFPKLLEKNGLRPIRFHDLRHSCASLLLANGVPMKQIQEWLGHSDFSTTANIYAHLDYASKLSSAQAMLEGLGYGNASA